MFGKLVENCENGRSLTHCWQVFLLCYKDSDINWEEQEAAEHPGDPLHDLQLDDRRLLLLHSCW